VNHDETRANRWFRTTALACIAAVALLAGLVAFFNTGDGTLDVVVPVAALAVDGKAIDVGPDGKVTIELPIGSHDVEITTKDGGRFSTVVTIAWRGQKVVPDFDVIQTNRNDPKAARIWNLARSFTSFKVEFEINVSSIDYAGGINFGLYNPDLNSQELPNYVQVVFARGDATKDDLARGQVFLDAKDRTKVAHVGQTGTRTYGLFELRKWYRVVLEYDAPQQRLTTALTDVESGKLAATLSCDAVPGFATEMTYLGSSNLRRGGFQEPAAEASARIRNVVLSVPGPRGHRIKLDPPQAGQEANFGNRKPEQ
jgi:hypothetical protein